MSQQSFPSFNFPFSSSVDLQLSLCDYGRTGPLAIYKDDQQNIRCFPQKKALSRSTTVRLHAEKPSLPIRLPNKTSRRFSFDGRQSESPRDVLQYTRRNLDSFSVDHGDILYNKLSSLVKSATDRSSLPAIGGRYGRARVKELNNFVSSLEDDLSVLSDIPFSILENLLAESYAGDMVESKGGYYGNCLAYQRNHSSRDTKIILASPGGCDMEKLILNVVEFSTDDMAMKLSQDKEVFTFPGRICEISMENECWDVPLIAVRSDYACSFFHGEFNEDNEKQGPAIKFLGDLACKTRPCSVIVNPYIPGEVAVTMETGSVYLWHASNCSLEVVKQCSACTVEEFELYFCGFGTHPRQMIHGNKTSVELLDLRASSSTGKELMTLPSPHFFKDDQFSAVQRHPQNPYHYFLGTNQSLVVMDERFQQNPVLKWYHSLLGPIKYINVVLDALPGTQDVLVVVGEYRHHEVHCYQYCYGEEAPQYTRVGETMGGLPPCSTLNPWKISLYSDWPNMVDLPNKADILPAIKKRLSAPLSGLACIPFGKHLSILQLSEQGDLFHQSLAPTVAKLIENRDEGQVFFYEEMENDHTQSKGCGKGKTLLSEWEQTLIETWVKSVECSHIEGSLSAVKEVGCCHVDVEVLRTLSNLECSSHCSLCTSGVENTGESKDSEICFYCGLEKAVSDKIAKVHSNTIKSVILTNSYLGLTHEVEELKIFDEQKEYCDPLGVALLKNWNSDVQVPVNLGGDRQSGVEVVDEYRMQDIAQGISQPMSDYNKSQDVVEIDHIPMSASPRVVSTPLRENEDGLVRTPQQQSSTKKKQKLSRVAGF